MNNIIQAEIKIKTGSGTGNFTAMMVSKASAGKQTQRQPKITNKTGTKEILENKTQVGGTELRNTALSCGNQKYQNRRRIMAKRNSEH